VGSIGCAIFVVGAILCIIGCCLERDAENRIGGGWKFAFEICSVISIFFPPLILFMLLLGIVYLILHFDQLAFPVLLSCGGVILLFLGFLMWVFSKF